MIGSNRDRAIGFRRNDAIDSRTCGHRPHRVTRPLNRKSPAAQYVRAVGARGRDQFLTDTQDRARTESRGVYGPVSYTHLDVYKRQAEHCDEDAKAGFKNEIFIGHLRDE